MPTTRMVVGFFAVAGGGIRGVSDVVGGCGMAGSSNEIPTELIRTAVRKGQFGAEKRPIWQYKI